MLCVTFDKKIPSSLSAQRVWELLCQSFEDSRTSPLWPRDLETLRAVDTPLRRGTRIKATYAFIGPLKSRQTYTLGHFDARARTMAYRAGRMHPLRGGGEVAVVETGSGCTIRWSGRYEPRLRPDALASLGFISLFFEDAFFDRIKHNLRALEALESATNGAPRLHEAA